MLFLLVKKSSVVFIVVGFILSKKKLYGFPLVDLLDMTK